MQRHGRRPRSTDVEGWAVGDEACALLSAGAYATHVAVPAGQLMPVPDGVDLVAAAALPEVACTVWSNVFMIAALQPDDVLLVHGGAGGIGSFAIQLASQLGARVLTTAGTAEKRDFCLSLGAEVAIDYHDEDFVEVVKERTEGAGADVILDNMGASYLERNVTALATEGRLVIIGMQGGTRGELDISALLRKRGAIIATTLRARARRREGLHLRVRRRARVAAGRRRQGARDRGDHRAARRRTPRARADGVRHAHREDPARHALRPAGYGEYDPETLIRLLRPLEA